MLASSTGSISVHSSIYPDLKHRLQRLHYRDDVCSIRQKKIPSEKQGNPLHLQSESVFFLLAAAWVDPGRSALQSAEQRCQGRYGRIHRFGCTSIFDKNLQEGHLYKQQQSTQGDRV